MPLSEQKRRPTPINPAKVIIIGFAGAILIGTLLLLLPFATEPEFQTGFTTALFTATSAVCVTGLVVVDTGVHWTTFGELIILLLIQVGGLGIMTLSTGVAMALGRKVTFRERMAIQQSMGSITLQGMVRLVRYVVLIAIGFQAVGAVLFALRWSGDYPLGRAVYLGVFHAISAFNNAGFDLFSVSFEPFVQDPLVNAVGIVLIIFGGIGFIVILDLYRFFRNQRHRLSLHTRLVLLSSIVLILFGAVFFLVSEMGNPETLGGLSWPGRLMASVFTAVTPRTAGFNTVTTADLLPGSLFLLILFMFIGGSPGSTAGGVKTTTFMALVLAVSQTFLGRSEIQVFGRRLKMSIIFYALTIVILSITLIFAVTLVLLFLENMPFLDTLFEVTSAFGTVGLSTGITPYLSTAGRLIITLLMFAGRVGPLTMVFALTMERNERGSFRYPEEGIMIG